MNEQGIPTMIYYPKPMHQQSAFAGVYSIFDDLSVAEDLCDKVLSLPIHPYLEEDSIMVICEAIAQIMEDIR